RAGVWRIPRAGGERELRAGREDARDVREIPPLRDGAGPGVAVVTRLQGHRHHAAELVCRIELRDLQRDELLAQLVGSLQPGRERDELRAPHLERIGIRRRRILGGRRWWWR